MKVVSLYRDLKLLKLLIMTNFKKNINASLVKKMTGISYLPKLNSSFFFLLILAFLSGCKKNQQLPNEKVVKHSNLVREWLASQPTMQTTDKGQLLEQVIQNLKDEEMRTEILNNEKLIIIPLKGSNELSKHLKQRSTTPLEFLLLVETPEGKIRRGDVLLFYPKNSMITDLPENSFHDFFTNNTLPVNGTLSLISLNDVKQYEMDFENGKPKEFRLWQPKPGSSSAENGEAQGRLPDYMEDCVDWYLVTTVYYTDGTTEQYEEYLFTECYGGSGGDGGGGGGGGGNPPATPEPEPVQKRVSFVVAAKQNQHYEGYSLSVEYFLEGMNYPGNSALNYFTSDPIFSGTGIIWYNPAYSIPTTSPWHTTYRDNVSQGGRRDANKTAWANLAAF
jgi:hypothetical protein